MNRRLNLSLALIAAAFCALPGSARAADQEENASLQGKSVFYASHSLMWYVPAPLGEFATASKIANHQLAGLQKIGASRTLQHWNLADADNLAKQALRTGQVDVLVMSPIQFPDEGIEKFVELGLQHNPRMRFLVQLSWGGGDVDNQDFPKGAWENVDREKTPEQLEKLFVRNIQAGEAQAAAINQKYGNGEKILFLIPTAQALVELRSRIARKEIPGFTNQKELYVDPAHPAPPLEALNAYLHYAVLYRRSPVGLPMPKSLSQADREAWDEQLNKTLQEIAWETAASYAPAGIPAAPDSDPLGFDVPPAEAFPTLSYVCTANVDIGPHADVGETPEGHRRFIPITGGTFAGPDLRGKIIPGGGDWNLSRRDGATLAEAAYLLRTDDDVVIRITNTGVGAPPQGLRFTTPKFEAPQGKYEWLNQSTFVGALDVDWKREHPIRIRVFRVE